MRKTCIICRKKIHRKGEGICKGKNTKGFKRMKTFRRPEDITCSRKCSRIYNRVLQHVKKTIELKIMKKYNL